MESVEGLQTLMLESFYHVVLGNVRVAWLIIRRALGIAELMDLPRLAKKGDHLLVVMWFRLIYSDRFLSVLLGLPFAAADDSFASPHPLAMNTPPERMERTHVVVMGGIIARNVCMQRSRLSKVNEDGTYDSYEATQRLDFELKQTAKAVPVSWWDPPSLSEAATHMDAMEKTAKLVRQIHQYYLLVLLHQPYLIQGLRPQTNRSIAGQSYRPVDHTYSRLAALSASRDVLSRFLVIRNFHKTPAYCGLDDKAFAASVTLLLAHIDGHSLDRANVLEHQRPHDVGIIEKMIRSSKELSGVYHHASSMYYARILTELAEIEANAANGAIYAMCLEDDDIREGDRESRSEESSLAFSIPYFGTFCIVLRQRETPQLAVINPDPALVPPSAHSTSASRQLCAPNGNAFLAACPRDNSSNAIQGSHLHSSAPLHAGLGTVHDPILESTTWPSISKQSRLSRTHCKRCPWWRARQTQKTASTKTRKGCSTAREHKNRV